MKKSFAILLLSLFMLTGCVSSVIKEKLSRNAAQLDGYVQRMDTGQPMATTPEEDQDLIRAMRIWTWEMNQGANGETPPDDIRLIIEARRRARGE
jgi:hypothetical protein